jgi:predicted transcriptional regulator of viral defense system
MKKLELIQRLAELDRRGVYVLARRDIEKLFPEENVKSMDQSLKRMVADGLLQRVARGLYLNPAASNKNRWVAEEIAKALRPGKLSYVSLESILSEYGVISQIPVNRMTVMTTGASGLVETPYGRPMGSGLSLSYFHLKPTSLFGSRSCSAVQNALPAAPW